MPGRKVRADWLTGQVPGTDGISAQPAADAYEVHGGQRLAHLIVLTVLCAFLAVQLIDILDSPIPDRGVRLTIGITSSCVVFALELFISAANSVTWSGRRRLGMLLAQAVVSMHSALNRTESRGAHAREDFPKRDDKDWLKHTMVWLDNGKVTIDYRPVHMYTLSNEVQPFPPKERVY